MTVFDGSMVGWSDDQKGFLKTHFLREYCVYSIFYENAISVVSG